jgi:Asp-tRNA(Asn)/Glu-tRNA(Gln) amidotransferase C subunit
MASLRAAIINNAIFYYRMNKDEVLRLAGLARVGIQDEEAEALSHEFDDILKYVGEVKAASQENPSTSSGQARNPEGKQASYGAGKKQETKEQHPILNVMREDGRAHESGKYTEDLLNAAPDREGDYVKVKQILG